MIKCTIDGIDIFHPLAGKLDKLIDYFVEFYGEKYRERITNRLKNTTYLFTGEISALENHSTFDDCEEYYDKKIENLTRAFFKELGAKNLKKVKYYEFKVCSFPKIAQILKDVKFNKFKLDNYDEDEVINFIVFLEAFGVVDSSDSIENNVENLHKFIKDEKNYLKVANLIISANKLWNLKYKKYIFFTGIDKKRKLEFFEKIEEKSQNIMDTYSDKIDEIFIELFSKIKNVSEESLRDNDDIYDYIDTFKDILEKDERFITNYDKQNRVALLNFLGIDFGENYEDYSQGFTILSDILNENKFFEKYDELRKNMFNDQIANCPYLVDSLTRLSNDNINLSETDLVYDIFQFILGETDLGAWTSAEKGEKVNQVHNLCVCKNYLNLCTSTLIHEMNHIIETDLIYNKQGENIGTKCGFEVFFYDNNKKTANTMYLNEIINDYLALKIYEKCKRDGFEIGAVAHKSSGYAKFIKLLKDFIDENLTSIIECRLSENPNGFKEFIGNKNYSLLNSAINKVAPFTEEEYKNCLKEIESKTKHASLEPLSSNAQILLGTMNDIALVRSGLKRKNSLKTAETSSERVKNVELVH